MLCFKTINLIGYVRTKHANSCKQNNICLRFCGKNKFENCSLGAHLRIMQKGGGNSKATKFNLRTCLI